MLIRRERLPTLRQFKRLLIVALGAVLGFPLLTSWAMESLPVSHGAVVLALLPLATTGFAVFRAGERPSLTFWLASISCSSAVIAWAIIIGATFFVIPVGLSLSAQMLHAPAQAWASFLYLAIVSQFLAYVAWYSGMAMGGIARVSQIQYLQPFLMILFAATFLGESISLFTMGAAVIVVLSVILGKNAGVSRKESLPEKN